MKYSTGFRNAVLQQVLPPNSRSIASVAKERGISPITINSWMKKLNDGTLFLDQDGSEPSPNQRSIHEKYKLLLESKHLAEDQLGEWLRKSGIHSEHLILWETEVETFVKNKDQYLKKELTDLKKENRKLRKEAERNKSAMAEALALLTLKKKVDRHFEAEEEE